MSEEQQRQDVETNPERSAAGEQTNERQYHIMNKKMQYDPLAIVFIIFLITMGIVGYVSKGSWISLVSSLIFALITLAAVYLDGAKRNSWGLVIVFALLLIPLLIIYYKSETFYPSGLVALITFLMFLRHSYLLYTRIQLAKA